MCACVCGCGKSLHCEPASLQSRLMCAILLGVDPSFVDILSTVSVVCCSLILRRERNNSSYWSDVAFEAHNPSARCVCVCVCACSLISFLADCKQWIRLTAWTKEGSRLELRNCPGNWLRIEMQVRWPQVCFFAANKLRDGGFLPERRRAGVLQVTSLLYCWREFSDQRVWEKW